MAMPPSLQVIDGHLIWFYRLTGWAALDFIIGTLVLILLCLMLGKATAAMVLKLLRPRLEKYGAEAARYQELAMAALKAGDKEAYRAANTLANEAFGHTFFQQIALSASYLWPICFALAWMQYRFLELAVPIPGTPWSLGFIGVFILLYIGTLFLVRAARNLKRLFIRLFQVQVRSSPAADSPPAP